MSSSELKRLNTELTELRGKRTEIQTRLHEVQRELDRVVSRINSIQKNITELTGRMMIVSEHAMLRYLERVENLDMEGLKLKVLGGKMPSNKLLNGTFPLGTHSVRIKDGVVLTVLTSKSQK